jgi:import inner membrane translocase subunit TIM10
MVLSMTRRLADLLAAWLPPHARNSLNKSCAKKCIPTDYHEGELNKGESVCLDRCAAKFFDVHFKVSDILQKQSQAGGAPGFGGFGN